jgi:hypothetical protein
MKLAIVGSRDYPDLFQVTAYIDFVCSEQEQYRVEASTTAEGYYEPGYDPMPVLVSGGARGVDTHAVEYGAKAWGLKSIVFPADWNKHGKRAGIVRNGQIVQAADFIVAFWDGKSRGTKSTIDLALSAHKHLEVFFP